MEKETEGLLGASTLGEDGPTRRKFPARLQGEITKRGTIDVLRLTVGSIRGVVHIEHDHRRGLGVARDELIDERRGEALGELDLAVYAAQQKRAKVRGQRPAVKAPRTVSLAIVGKHGCSGAEFDTGDLG